MNDSASIFLAGSLVTAIVVIGLVLFILLVIAYWKIFKKAGEPGWKSIIPIYNEYMIFKISWKGSWFWITVLLGVITCVLWYLDPGTIITFSKSGAAIAAGASPGILFYIGCAILFVALVINLVLCYKLGQSFGHGAGFLIACILVPNIAMLYLGFGKSQYIGNDEMRAANTAYTQQNYQDYNQQYGNQPYNGQQYGNQQYGGQQYNNQQYQNYNNQNR